MFIKICLTILLIEAIVEILTESTIFIPFRAFLFEKGKNSKVFAWLHDLMDCGYCTSVWVGCFFALLLFTDRTYLLNVYVDWIFIGLALHRLSNIFHILITKIKGKDDIFDGEGI